MPDQVKVDDLEVFGRFRATLLKFGQAAGQTMASADSEISRTHAWLEGEQMTFWQSQLRKRVEMVAKARDAVRQKKLYKDFAGKQRQAIEEEKFLEKCLAAQQEAEEKINAVRKWLPRLEKAADLYHSGVGRLSKTIVDDVPRAVALLDRLALSLEEYLQVAAPVGGGGESAPVNEYDDSMSRGGDGAAAQEPAKTETVAPAAPLAGAPAAEPAGPAESEKEGKNVQHQ